MTARCEICNGRRELLGMGGMIHKCKSCSGTGWVQEAIDPTAVTIDKRSRQYRQLKKYKEV